MNSMERVVMALNHQEPDRVPVYPLLAGVSRNLIGANCREWSTDADTCAKGLLKAREEFDLDCIVTLIDLSVECTAWGQELVFPEHEAAHPNYKNQVIGDEDEYDKIQYVDFHTCDRMMMHIDVCKKLVEASKGEFPVIAFVFGPLGTLSMLRNQEEMYVDCIEQPEVVHDTAGIITQVLQEYCDALLDTGVQGIMFDTLFSSGSIMSKDMWDELEGEWVQQLAEHVHARGAMVMIHNCGGKIYFDAQINRMHPEAISFLYPPDDCTDFVECKEKYGDVTTLIGCVAPTTVTVGTPEKVEAECKANIDAMAKGGGFMLATGCELISPDAFDNARLMVDIAKTYGAYKK